MQQDIVVIPNTVHRERISENYDVFDFELDDEDMDAIAALEDPDFPRFFDHFDVGTVRWLLHDLVKEQQLGGGVLY